MQKLLNQIMASLLCDVFVWGTSLREVRFIYLFILEEEK